MQARYDQCSRVTLTRLRSRVGVLHYTVNLVVPSGSFQHHTLTKCYKTKGLAFWKNKTKTTEPIQFYRHHLLSVQKVIML